MYGERNYFKYYGSNPALILTIFGGFLCVYYGMDMTFTMFNSEKDSYIGVVAALLAYGCRHDPSVVLGRLLGRLSQAAGIAPERWLDVALVAADLQ